MRSKTEYMQIEVNGKKQIQKVGMAPIQRDGIEYEFTTVFDLSQNHTATVSKDRTNMFDGQYFTPSAECGKALLHWLTVGEAPALTDPQPQIQPVNPAPVAMPAAAPTAVDIYKNRLSRIWHDMKWDASGSLDAYLAERMKSSGKTAADITADDLAAVDKEITDYLSRNGFAQIAEVKDGEIVF